MAYIAEDSAPRKRTDIVPLASSVAEGRNVVIDYLEPCHMEAARQLLNDEIDTGLSFPYRHRMSTDAFAAYFCSHDAFQVVEPISQELVGIFYCKPNFPGRCSHYCNGGFITKPSWRRKGLGKLMATTFIAVARDVDYRCIMFNLVFVANTASVGLWRSLGFTEVGVLPGVGDLKDIGYTDAIQFVLKLY